METGEYFMTEQEKKSKDLSAKLKKSEDKFNEKIAKKQKMYEAPEVDVEIKKEEKKEKKKEKKAAKEADSIEDLKKKFMGQGTKKVKIF